MFREAFGVRRAFASLWEHASSCAAPLARAELNALCKWKLRRKIDRVRLSPHVVLPAIAAALASTAGILLPAKCAADFCAAGAGIHVRNSAIAPDSANKSFSFAHIIGENR